MSKKLGGHLVTVFTAPDWRSMQSFMIDFTMRNHYKKTDNIQEIHFYYPDMGHPTEWAKEIDEIVRQASPNRRYIIPTFRDDVITYILTWVARGAISPEEVCFCWIGREKKRKGKKPYYTHRKHLPDKFGRMGEWPCDYSDVYLKMTSAYLDATSNAIQAAMAAGEDVNKH